MQAINRLNVNLLDRAEQELRFASMTADMKENGIQAALIRDNANIFYLTGRVFRGYVYIDTRLEEMHYFVRRPNHLCGTASLHYIRKPEEITAELSKAGLPAPAEVALELDAIPFSEAVRLARAFGMERPASNISPVIRACRAVKTEYEQNLLRDSGRRQTLVYKRIPQLYSEGMTDIELQIEIERALRLEGCLGQFRISGGEMELFMGNVLTGENADTPSPYDFAMGGEGTSPSLPVGANGTLIRPEHPVMVDMNGNFNGYMTDMTRCYAPAEPNPQAARLNALSERICDTLAEMMRPGAAASDLYAKALEIAAEAGMEQYFMGHRSHAGFVGHGIGIEVNELPVIAPRSRDILAAGNVIALEPKFVVPGLGAVGIENTYIVKENGRAECITNAPTDIVRLS